VHDIGFVAPQHHARLLHGAWKGADKAQHAAWLESRDHLWRAQCNCPYWHGVFGGLYLPHLRAAVYSTPAMLARLFSVPRAEVEAALRRLERVGLVELGAQIEGQAGRWVVSV